MPDHFRQSAHSFLGIFSASLPAGLVIVLIVYWIAPEIAILFPSPHREALQSKIKTLSWSPRQAFTVACGIVVGATTHVVWDSLTHENGWFEQAYLFQRPLLGIPLYFGLQILSSAIGFSFLLYCYDRWAIEEGFRLWTWRGPTSRFFLWSLVLVVCVVLAAIESHTVQAITTLSFRRSRHFALILTTSFVRDFLIVLCLIAIFLKLFNRRARLDLSY
jgi:hypothetical protein